LAELDEAAATGRVPASLLRRWEAALEDVALWRFQPVTVHGDLAPEHVHTAEGRVTAVTGWGEARVADPADDLSWLLAAAPPQACESVMEAYLLRRTELHDPRLVERALLLGELAVARWLLYGVRNVLSDVVRDAEAMLADLDAATQEGNDDDLIAAITGGTSGTGVTVVAGAPTDDDTDATRTTGAAQAAGATGAPGTADATNTAGVEATGSSPMTSTDAPTEAISYASSDLFSSNEFFQGDGVE
jgi:hypothetical protein